MGILPFEKSIIFPTRSRSSVREWLKGLSNEEKRVIGIDIQTVQYGWPLGMPLVKSMGYGIWEIRSSLPNSKIARVLFIMNKNRIILLHGFITHFFCEQITDKLK